MTPYLPISKNYSCLCYILYCEFGLATNPSYSAYGSGQMVSLQRFNYMLVDTEK